MLTREDIQTLIEAGERSREKAIISFMWETGVRTGELLNIKLGDISAVTQQHICYKSSIRTAIAWWDFAFAF